MFPTSPPGLDTGCRASGSFRVTLGWAWLSALPPPAGPRGDQTKAQELAKDSDLKGLNGQSLGLANSFNI